MDKPQKTFLVTYHSGAAGEKRMKSATPEERDAMMQAWMDWAQKCGENLEEIGAPLSDSVNLRANSRAQPSKRRITGYSKLKAKSMAAAKKLLKSHPHLTWARGCEIEVHEVRPMG